MGKNSQRQKTGSSPVLKPPIAREFSSGGVVFKKENGQVLWLVAKSVANEFFPTAFWRLPKGWLDDEAPGVPGPMASGKVRADEDSLRKTAIREVEEEGGVEAKIISKVGTTNYIYSLPTRGRIFKFVTFYLMEWKRDLPQGFDGETSEIVWLPFEKVYKMLHPSTEKQILKKANEILASLA